MTSAAPPPGSAPGRVLRASPPAGGELDSGHVWFSIQEALRVVRRRKWLVLGIFAVTLPAAAFVWLTWVPQYRATAAIRLADARSALTGGLDAPSGGIAGRSVDPVLSEIEVIKSRGTAREVVDSDPALRVATRGIPLRLLGLVELTAARLSDSVQLTFRTADFLARAQGEQAAAAYGDLVELNGLRFTVTARPGVNAGVLQVADREAAVSLLLAGLEVAPRRNTDIVDIAYTAPDPDRAVLAANAVADVYQQVDLRGAQRQARFQRQFFEERLRVSDSILQAARTELADFRAGKGTPPAVLEAEVQNLRVQGQQLNAELRIYQALRARLQSPTPGVRREAIRAAMAQPDVAANVEVSRLHSQLMAYESRRDSLLVTGAPSNPDVRRVEELLASGLDRLVEVAGAHLQGLTASLDARMATLDAFRSRTEENYRRESRSTAQEQRLIGQVETASNLSDQLREQYQQARLAETVEVGRVQVLERAVAAYPVGVGPLRKVALLLFVGLMLAVSGAFVAERFNTAIRGRKELGALGLPVLGVVPQLKEKGNGKTSAKLTTPVIEALRGVRLNLIYAHGTAGSLVATVSSPGNGDGKSFVAANLALAFAYAGHQTLLVDGDVRRGVLHRLMGAQRKPGLTDYLLEQAASDQIVQQTQFPRLHFIACGTRTAQAPEFLGSGAMSRLVMTLRSHYGVVLIDSPPLGAGVDALSLGTVTGNMLLVIRGGRTDRELTEAKLDLLDPLPIRLLGAVINGVGDDSGRYYTYYMAGYEFEDDKADEAGKVVGAGSVRRLTKGGKPKKK
jgi:capsular exopolysaccharide synthesis family protein